VQHMWWTRNLHFV